MRKSFTHNDMKDFADVGGGILDCQMFYLYIDLDTTHLPKEKWETKEDVSMEDIVFYSSSHLDEGKARIIVNMQLPKQSWEQKTM